MEIDNSARVVAHIGRSWASHEIEDQCPCPQAACGLIPDDAVNPDCDHHPATAHKTMRQNHRADECPAVTDRQH